MQVIKPTQLGLSTRVIEHQGRMAMCVSAALYFPMGDGERRVLWSEPSMWKFLTVEMEGQPLVDEGVIKTRPEYLLRAVACPPGGAPAPACAVRARVGPLEKTLTVHGHRYWHNGRASAPVPFERMPLGWHLTWGGADVPENPLGRGRAVFPIDTVEAHWLPNVEYASHPVGTPSQTGVPASFDRIDPMWASRAQWRGTYDEAWYKTHAPGFPPDIDWQHFNLASPDQWFPGELTGDEPYAFEHLHPEKPVVAGRLPGVITRCVVRYGRGPNAGKLRDVPMRLTTLWFFPHVERVVMIAQGIVPVTEDDGQDIELLMGGVEALGSPKTQDHYLNVLKLRQDPEYGAIYALRDADLLPEGVSSDDPAFDALKSEYEMEGFVADNQFRRAEVQVAQIRKKVQSLGLDPDKFGIKAPVRPKKPTLEQLPDYLRTEVARAKGSTMGALKQAAEDVQRAEKIARAHNVDLAAASARRPPAFSAAAEFNRLASVMPAGSSPDMLKRLKSKLMQAEDAERLSYWMTAHRQTPIPRVAPAESARMLDALQKVRAAGLPTKGAKLTGVDLSGQDLAGLDLSGAQMENAVLAGANLEGANLSFAVLAHADLTGARLTGARLEGTNLGRATLKQAVCEAAHFDTAVLSGANFEGAIFRGSSLKGVDVSETPFKASDWSQCVATSMTLIKAEIEGVAFAATDLSQCTFIECTFKRCSFVRARLHNASFVTCTFEDVHFDQADLLKATFVQGCTFQGVRAPGARLREANLRGAVLKAGLFEGADFTGADVSEVDFTAARLTGASFAGAMMIRTVLHGAHLVGANLMNAIAQKADLRSADLRNANLYGSDLSRIWRDDITVFDGANFDRARTHPLRKEAPAAP